MKAFRNTLSLVMMMIMGSFCKLPQVDLALPIPASYALQLWVQKIKSGNPSDLFNDEGMESHNH
jgi:hypothetical protein